MEKYILSLISCIMLSISADLKAQQISSLWLNGIAGISSNWILNQNAYGNQEMNYASSMGLTGGIGTSYFISRKWGVSGSVLVSQVGQNYSGLQAGAMSRRKVTLTYLELPLLLLRQFPKMRNPTWISVGPDILLLIKAKQEYSREEGGARLPNEEGMAEGDITQRFKAVDIAMNISLNRMVELNYLRSVMLLFSLNSSLGLLDINSAEWQIPNTHNVYQPSHNFYLGAKIGLMFKVARVGAPNW